MIKVTIHKRLRASRGDLDLAVDMELAPGELAALYGPSGAGKTSLLRMVAGLLRPDEGRIVAGGETWFDSSAGIDLPARRRRAGLVFQDYALFPNMSVRGNLAYALPKGADRSRVDALLEAADLAGLADRRPATLSGGQRQRVALARALASGPRLLLLDEPLAALDPALRARLQDLIAALQRESGLPTLLVTHDPGEIVRLASRVFRLEDGRIAGAGAPAEVFGGGRMSGKVRLRGSVLAIEAADVVRVVSVLVGAEVVRVTALPADVEGLNPGDPVTLAAKAFNPMLFRG
jgi:molybdate transport system ATP-binding protein